jgi:DNA-binding IclR family transcriptional regulator
MTLRDSVWDAALEELASNGELKVADILEDIDAGESQRQTVRRCLKELEQKGWLERESKYSSIWRIGEKGELLLQLSEGEQALKNPN